MPVAAVRAPAEENARDLFLAFFVFSVAEEPRVVLRDHEAPASTASAAAAAVAAAAAGTASPCAVLLLGLQPAESVVRESRVA